MHLAGEGLLGSRFLSCCMASDYIALLAISSDVSVLPSISRLVVFSSQPYTTYRKNLSLISLIGKCANRQAGFPFLDPPHQAVLSLTQF